LSFLLKYPGDYWVDEETLKLAKESLPLMRAFHEQEGRETPPEYPLRKIIKEPLREVYTVPFLNPKLCKVIIEHAKKHGFKPNDEEDELRQIPEYILEGEVKEAFTQLTKSILNPVFMSIWHTAIKDAHIQVANYNVRDKRQGAWHHDRSADITVVVPLNTGEYSGGGTEFLWRGAVNPLPTGTALIFPSLTHMHRGLPVDSGDRFLLVFWLKVDHES